MPQTNQWLEQIAPQVNELWRGFWSRGTVEPARFLYDHEMVIVSKGGCRIQIDAETHELGAGTFLIVPPTRYHVTTAGIGGVHRYCIHFDWSGRPGRPTQNNPWVYHPSRPRENRVKHAPEFVPQHCLTGSFDLAGPVLPLLETLHHNWQTGQDFDRAICREVFGQILVRLLWQRVRATPMPDRTARLAYAVKELLDQAPPGTVSVQTLLPTLGFSYAHLARLFKKRFGISPVRYRNAARLERAKNLLQDPKRTIAAAAYEVGFNDPAYFSRQFRQSHGVAPKFARA